jgi:hypothetical protein
MKLATIALASAFALSSTLALAASTKHHKSGAKTYKGTVGMSSSRTKSKGSMNDGLGRYGGSSNDRGGLVGGADPGTYRP